MSLYLLLELPLGTLFVWWATERRHRGGYSRARGLLCTMATESWTGIAESRRVAEKAGTEAETEAESETEGGGVERSGEASGVGVGKRRREERRLAVTPTRDETKARRETRPRARC